MPLTDYPNWENEVALEDPSAAGMPMPPASGRIVFPSGAVQTSRYQPMAQEDMASALQAAAKRAHEFDAAQRRAQQEAEEEQAMKDMLANTRAEDAQKATELAIRFQATRQFKRDVEAYLERGLPLDQAQARSAVDNLMAFGGGTGAAAFIRGVTQRSGMQFPEMPWGEQIAVMPGGSVVRERAEPRTGGTPTLAQQTEYLRKKVGELEQSKRFFEPGTPGAKKAQADYEEALAELRDVESRFLGRKPASLVPRGTAAPTTSAPAATGVRVRRKADGKVFVYRGDAADVPTDKYEVIQ